MALEALLQLSSSGAVANFARGGGWRVTWQKSPVGRLRDLCNIKDQWALIGPNKLFR